MSLTTSGSDEPLEQIKRAFHSDDAETVRLLLDRHPEFKTLVKAPIGPFDSPAIVNVRSAAMLDALLEAGADLNAKSNWWAGGFGLLHLAPPELAAYAIERGATVDAHAAARLGLLQTLKELVANDPELVHAKGGDGQTPLHFASSVEIAAFLLDNGAEIDVLDVDHQSTPAQYMVGDRQEVVRFLIQRGCRTDILMAAAVGDLELVRNLLDADPDCIRTCVSDEYFPLIGGQAGGTIYQWTLGWHVSPHQVARKYGREEVLSLLLERSPAAIKLIDACWMGDAARVHQLHAEHPEIAAEYTDADRRQAAHAARNNETMAVRLLLESGIPVDGKSQHQATPLHWAAFHGNREMVEAILPFGPPLELRDADHHGTPLGWAVYGSQHGWYCETGDFAGTVEALLRAGAELPETIGGSPAVQDALRKHRSSAP